jgi:hypothetical protein
VAALPATRTGEAVGENSALQVATQLPFGMGRDALLLPILVAQGKEGLEVALHRALEWRLGRAPSAIRWRVCIPALGQACLYPGSGCETVIIYSISSIASGSPGYAGVAPAGALAPKIGGIVLFLLGASLHSEFGTDTSAAMMVISLFFGDAQLLAAACRGTANPSDAFEAPFPTSYRLGLPLGHNHRRKK